jgi:hypothetical protein
MVQSVAQRGRNQRLSQDDGRQTTDDRRYLAGCYPLSVVYRQWSIVITRYRDLVTTNILAHDANLAGQFYGPVA